MKLNAAAVELITVEEAISVVKLNAAVVELIVPANQVVAAEQIVVAEVTFC